MASGSNAFYKLEHTTSEGSLHSQSTEYGDAEIDEFIAQAPENIGSPVDDEEFDVPIRTSTPPLSLFSSEGSSPHKRKSYDDLGHDPRAPCKRTPSVPDLEPHFLAHSSPVITDGLLFGIQWEFARLKGSEGSLPMDGLNQLRNLDNYQEQAPLLYELLDENLSAYIALYDAEASASSPWVELDFEAEASKVAAPSGLLGCNEEAAFVASNPAWHGGKVHFQVKLTKTDKSALKLTLEKPYLGSSTRMTRRFGSDKFIRVKIASGLVYSEGVRLITFFQQPFVFNDRVYRAFFAKDSMVILVQTAESLCKTDSGLNITSPTCVPGVLPFLDFLDWHNPLKLNSSQSMAKWTSRFALGLSTSVPGVRVKPENYIPISDIENITPSLVAKTPSHLIMTDGCGFASQSLLTALYHKFHWDTFPTAVQMRVNGAKGLLLLHPTHTEHTHKIWVRPSQTKIHHPSSTDPDLALFTVDLLRSSHMTSPAKMSVEILINLAENGVLVSTLATLIKVSTEERLARLLGWEDTPQALRVLWDNVAREGRVLSARLSRTYASQARALGLRYEDPEEEVEDDLDGIEGIWDQSKAWWDDPISGQPSSLEETVLQLLDSGFSPSHSPILQMKLAEVARKALKSCIAKYKIEIKQSCTAFIVPDPFDILEPGEVHIKSSTRSLVDAGGYPSDIVVGDVLLTRHPCKVASDVQKAKAVIKPQLHNFVDVIVISTRGHIVGGNLLPQHLASMTGGGDYDGDVMFAYWAPELLQDFKEADPSFAAKPDGLDKYLVKPLETVQEFQQRVPSDNYQLRIYELQKHLLCGLSNADVVGRINGMWENSMFVNGYHHPETVRLAYLFCEALDGSKTGVTVNPDYYKILQRKYSQAPPWKSDGKVPQMDNRRPLVRPPHLGRFIMDELHDEATKIAAGLYRVIDSKDPSRNAEKPRLDEDLVAPFQEAEERAKRLEAVYGRSWIDALESLKEHVDEVRKVWNAEKKKLGSRGGGKSFTDAPIEHRQDVLRKVSRIFNEGPPAPDIFSAEEWARLRASCAYKKSHGYLSSVRFPFDVAFRELCTIKANAVSKGRAKSILPGFYEGMSIHKKFVKIEQKLGK